MRRFQKARRIVKLVVKPKPSFEVPISSPDHIYRHPNPYNTNTSAGYSCNDTPSPGQCTPASYCSPTDSYLHRRYHRFSSQGGQYQSSPSLEPISPLRFARFLATSDQDTPTSRSVRQMYSCSSTPKGRNRLKKSPRRHDPTARDLRIDQGARVSPRRLSRKKVERQSETHNSDACPNQNNSDGAPAFLHPTTELSPITESSETIGASTIRTMSTTFFDAVESWDNPFVVNCGSNPQYNRDAKPLGSPLALDGQAQTQVDTRTQMYAGRCIGTQDQQGQGQDLNGTMQSIDHRPTLWITMPTPDMSNSQCCSSASVSNFIPFPGSRDNDIAYRNSSTIQPDPKLNLNPPQPSNLKSISPYSTIPKNNINTGTESRHALGASRTPAFKRCTLHGDTIIDPGAANPTSTTDGSGYQAKRRSLPTHASININECATPPANAANPISDPSQDSPSAAFQVSDQLLPIPACKHRSERRLTWTKVLRAFMPKKRFSFNNGPPAGEVSGIISTASTDLRSTRRMTAPGSMAGSVPALGPGPISASVTSSARPAPGDIEIDTSSSSKPKRLLKSAGHRSAPPAPRVAFASLLL